MGCRDVVEGVDCHVVVMGYKIAYGFVVSGMVHSQRIAHIEEEALWAANAIVKRGRGRIEVVSTVWASTHCAFGAQFSDEAWEGRESRKRSRMNLCFTIHRICG
jgi:hypothetical protein